MTRTRKFDYAAFVVRDRNGKEFGRYSYETTAECVKERCNADPAFASDVPFTVEFTADDYIAS